MPPLPPHPLQFATRHLLVVMAAVAILSAFMGPWMRTWSSLQWMILGLHLAALLAAFGWMLVRRWWKRKAALALAGDVRWVVPIASLAAKPARHPLIHLAPNAYLAALVGLFELTAFAAIHFDTVGGEAALWPCMAGVTIGLLAGGGVFDEPCPPARTWIAEGGLFLGTTFVPHSLLEFSVSHEEPSRPITVYWDRFAGRLGLTPEIREEVFGFLSARMRRVDRHSLTSSANRPPEGSN
ncbi:MAG: hypothetical protein WEH44_04160 [Pirellulaceae bacterium]